MAHIPVADVLSSIQNYSEEELVLLARGIGQKAHAKTKSIAHERISKGSVNSLRNFDNKLLWDDDQNHIVKSFVEGVMSLRYAPEPELQQRKRHMHNTLESLYAAINFRFVSTRGLMENLTMYSYTGSQAACQIMGASHAAGSVTTVKNAIKELAKDEPKIPPNDVIVVYDNTQVIGKTHRLKYQSTQPSSVVTASAAIHNPTLNHKLSRNPNVSRFLPTPGKTPEKIKESMMAYNAFQVESEKTLGDLRNIFIKSRLELVLRELDREKSPPEDHVTKNDPSRESQGVGLKYDNIPLIQNKARVIDLPVQDINPNSRENVKKVLENIQRDHKASDPERKWIVLHSDGTPYLHSLDLIQNTFYCPVCDEDVEQPDVHEHSKKHPNLKAADFKRRFYDLIIRPGAGHYEINLTRSIFAVFFDIFILPVAKLSGHKTPKAQMYAKKALNLHKSMEMLMVLLEALTSEVMYAYCSSVPSGTQPTFDGFIEWNDANQNPNYQLLTSFVFSILFPLFILHAAIRRCNDDLIFFAREKCSSIFYATRHPCYQRLNFQDIFYILSLEQPFKSFIGQNSIINESTNTIFGESIDFIQETRNRALKTWVPRSVPSFFRWMKASCSLGDLENIKHDVCEMLGLDVVHGKKNPTDLRRLIYETRKYFRANYNISPGNNNFCFPTNRNIQINRSFLNIVSLGETNRMKYYTAMLTGQPEDNVYMEIPRIAVQLDQAQLLALIRKKIPKLPAVSQGEYQRRLRLNLSYSELEEINNEIMDEFLEVKEGTIDSDYDDDEEDEVD